MRQLSLQLCADCTCYQCTDACSRLSHFSCSGSQQTAITQQNAYSAVPAASAERSEEHATLLRFFASPAHQLFAGHQLLSPSDLNQLLAEGKGLAG